MCAGVWQCSGHCISSVMYSCYIRRILYSSGSILMLAFIYLQLFHNDGGAIIQTGLTTLRV
jgi:hypothetical protein